ncbi:MAG: hypothetical protein GY882_11205 [Actinomycetia bacterium]|nr:hypothetical protein [Actinomycetes bacterium]
MGTPASTSSVSTSSASKSSASKPAAWRQRDFYEKIVETVAAGNIAEAGLEALAANRTRGAVATWPLYHHDGSKRPGADVLEFSTPSGSVFTEGAHEITYAGQVGIFHVNGSFTVHVLARGAEAPADTSAVKFVLNEGGRATAAVEANQTPPEINLGDIHLVAAPPAMVRRSLRQLVDAAASARWTLCDEGLGSEIVKQARVWGPTDQQARDGITRDDYVAEATAAVHAQLALHLDVETRPNVDVRTDLRRAVRSACCALRHKTAPGSRNANTITWAAERFDLTGDELAAAADAAQQRLGLTDEEVVVGLKAAAGKHLAVDSEIFMRAICVHDLLLTSTPSWSGSLALTTETIQLERALANNVSLDAPVTDSDGDGTTTFGEKSLSIDGDVELDTSVGIELSAEHLGRNNHLEAFCLLARRGMLADYGDDDAIAAAVRAGVDVGVELYGHGAAAADTAELLAGAGSGFGEREIHLLDKAVHQDSFDGGAPRVALDLAVESGLVDVGEIDVEITPRAGAQRWLRARRSLAALTLPLVRPADPDEFTATDVEAYAARAAVLVAYPHGRDLGRDANQAFCVDFAPGDFALEQGDLFEADSFEADSLEADSFEADELAA